MTPDEKTELLEALERIEHHSDEIFVRQGNRNVALPDLPAIEALEYVCKWLRRFTLDRPSD